MDKGGLANHAATLLRISFVIVLVLILIPGGSVRFAPLYLFSACMFVVTGLAAGIVSVKADAVRLVLPALAVAVVLLAWTVIQSASFPGNPFANGIWAQAAAATGYQASAISIAPTDTLAAAIPLMLPFATFVCAVLLFDSDDRAVLLLRILVAIAVAGSIVGIVQLGFFPDRLLFFEKNFYRDAATVFFVNRNTTATYLAIHLVVAVGLAFHHGQEMTFGGFDQVFRIGRRARQWPRFVNLSIYGLAAVILLCTLLLTKSRAGLGAGMAGLMVTGMILAYCGPVRSGGQVRLGRTRPDKMRWIRVGLVFVVFVAAALMFGGRAIQRVIEAGSEDGRYCAYPHILRLLADHWAIGTGLGTFMDAFTAYRSAACGILPIWDKAHSVYFEAWITLGVIAPIVALFIIGWLFWALIKGTRNRKTLRWAPVAGIGVMIVVVLHSAVDFSLQIPGFAAAFAAMLAALVRISLIRRKRPKA